MCENCAETHPSLPVGTRWKAYRPLLAGNGTLLRCVAQETWSPSRRLLYTDENWEAKMEIPVSLC